MFCLCQIFRSQLNFDLRYIINFNQKIPEYLSSFIHDKLHHDSADQDVQILFDKIMMLWDYLREKDVFERWYHRHLAQRLLSDQTMSNNAENNMILRLRTKCSSQFTYQLEGMFKDMFVSKEMMRNFPSSVAQKSINVHHMDLSVRVLTTAFWPIQNLDYQCYLPPLVNEIYQCFENFYLNTHNGRRLALQPSLGTADLTVVFYDGPKSDDVHEEQSRSTISKMITERKHTLQVSTHQMIILMLFNTRESYSYEVSLRSVAW